MSSFSSYTDTSEASNSGCRKRITRPARPLGDSRNRSYAAKLNRYARFAARELNSIFAELPLPGRGTALDLGCGTGLATALLAEALGPDVLLVGLDLSRPHLEIARNHPGLRLVQGDAEQLCLRERSFDFIWSFNTINHAADCVAVLRSLRRRLRPGGRLVLAQSGFLPEMFFAWDSHLDDAVRTACHLYYRDRYGLAAHNTEDLRAIAGLMRVTEFEDIQIRTCVIERTQPLSRVDREYFQESVFEGTWGARIRPFLEPGYVEVLDRNCDPESPAYCLDRPDFHHIQTITICHGVSP